MASLYAGRLNDALHLLRIAHKAISDDPTRFRQLKEGWIDGIKRTQTFCDELELEGPAGHIAYVLRAFDQIPDDELKNELREIKRHLMGDAGMILFEAIPRRKGGLYGAGLPAPAATVFPSANAEFQEATTCVAVGRYTAGAFHFCRASEHGLRALARASNVKRKVPIDYQEWGNLIDGIEKRVEKIKTWPRGPLKLNALEFYRGALGDALWLKDAARNLLMHTRKQRFKESEAMGVGTRAQDFLTRLASRITENQGRTLARKDFSS